MLNLIPTKTENFLLPSQIIIVVINVYLVLHFLLGLYFMLKVIFLMLAGSVILSLIVLSSCFINHMSVFTNCLYFLTMYMLYSSLIHMLLTKSTSCFCLCDCVLDLWIVNKWWWCRLWVGVRGRQIGSETKQCHATETGERFPIISQPLTAAMQHYCTIFWRITI